MSSQYFEIILSRLSLFGGGILDLLQYICQTPASSNGIIYRLILLFRLPVSGFLVKIISRFIKTILLLLQTTKLLVPSSIGTWQLLLKNLTRFRQSKSLFTCRSPSRNNIYVLIKRRARVSVTKINIYPASWSLHLHDEMRFRTSAALNHQKGTRSNLGFTASRFIRTFS